MEQHGFVHLSSGDLLRAERNSGSKNAELINSIIEKGEMVPGDITINLIKDAMKKFGWGDKRFLIDGFPRNEDNQNGWKRILADDVNMEFVLYLECTEDLMIKRILKRASDAGENSRSDDNEETLRNRLRIFKEQSMPIVNIYS